MPNNPHYHISKVSHVSPLARNGCQSWTFSEYQSLFLRQKKSTTFFHARISRSGKGQVGDFSATRVRVESVGSPRVAEKITHEAPTASGIREVEKSTFSFGKYGIFFGKLAFLVVICGI
jgi:hypothetical protein